MTSGTPGQMSCTYTAKFKIVIIFFPRRNKKLYATVFVNIPVGICFYGPKILFVHIVFQPDFIF